MIFLEYLSYYLIIGVIFMFVIDALMYAFYNQIISLNEDPSFDWYTRIFTIVVWPVTLVVIIKGFIEGRF
jgi:Na+-driven multidrug efflux pump